MHSALEFIKKAGLKEDMLARAAEMKKNVSAAAATGSKAAATRAAGPSLVQKAMDKVKANPGKAALGVAGVGALALGAKKLLGKGKAAQPQQVPQQPPQPLAQAAVPVRPRNFG